MNSVKHLILRAVISYSKNHKRWNFGNHIAKSCCLSENYLETQITVFCHIRHLSSEWPDKWCMISEENLVECRRRQGLVLKGWAGHRRTDVTEADMRRDTFRTQPWCSALWEGAQRKGEHQLFSAPHWISEIWMPRVPPNLFWSWGRGLGLLSLQGDVCDTFILLLEQGGSGKTSLIANSISGLQLLQRKR